MIQTVCTLIICLFFQTLSAQTYWLNVIRPDGKKLPGLSYPEKNKSIEERNRAINRMLNDLRNRGFLAATIDSTQERGDSLIAWLQPGEPFRWAYIAKGNADEAACRFSGFREKMFSNAVLNPKQVAGFMTKMLRYYQNNGYPFAQIDFDSIRMDGQHFRASIRVKTGDLFLTDSLNYRGDARISERYLQNYLGIKPGDVYREDLIEAIQARIKEIPFVQVYRPADVFLTGRSALIRLYLNGKRASNFSGIIGFLPNSSAQGKLLLTGEANLKIKNGLGKGESIEVEWKRLQAATQSLNAGISWPFLLNTPFGVSANFKLYKKDTAFISIQPGIGIQWLMRGTDYLKAFYELRSSSLLSTKGLESVSTLPDYADVRTTQSGLELQLTRLDYRYNPRRGFQFLARVAAGKKTIQANPALNPTLYEGVPLHALQMSALLEGSLFVPLFNRSTFLIGCMASWLDSPVLFENELPRIGGINSLRGFNEEAIFASSYGILNLEYRYLLEENAFLFAFANGAWYENRAMNRGNSDLPYGFGAGISFETRAGIFSISYALGSEQQNPIQFRSAKVHFGIRSLF